MNKATGSRHENYEVLNLIGYGLAKFEGQLVAALGFKTKSAYFSSLIERGVAKTRGTLKNRQDLFNPLVRNDRIGWWQNGDRYLHRKTLLDSLFGDLDVGGYASMLQNYVQTRFPVSGEAKTAIVPILKSKFRQLQETGAEAELFFMNNYRTIDPFANGALQDARLFGDGYDFQIEVESRYYLAEIKGLRGNTGGIRLTSNEYDKATEFGEKYCLAVVSSLIAAPRMRVFFDPLSGLKFSRQTIRSEQVCYSTPARLW